MHFLWTWQIDPERPHEGDLPPIYNTNTTGFGLSAWQRGIIISERGKTIQEEQVLEVV